MGKITALILAGGFGTRLQSVVKDVPKPMADVRGEPFLAHLIRYYQSQGVTQFVLSVGYKAESIIDYFGHSFESATIQYVREDQPLGTGGAIKYALNHLAADWLPSLIVNGDTWFEPNVGVFATFARSKNTPVCLSVKPMQLNDRYGSVLLGANDNISGFRAEPSNHANINAGCYYIQPLLLQKILASYPDTFSFESICLPKLAQAGQLSAYICDARFLDIGIPMDYAKAAALLP
jgi:D-glycero-alpha-D-manno-heptose 1-phosphate guanylyltransferase